MALKLLLERQSNPKLTCQYIAEQTGYSRKQITRMSKELEEKDMQSLLIHGNTGRQPSTTATDQEVNYLKELKKKYPDITIAQFRDIFIEDIIQNPTMQSDVIKYGLKERSSSWFRELFVKEGWKSPANKPIRMDGSRVTHPIRRPRDRMGELVQIDGTPYDWFRDGRAYVLHIAVDDASTRVLGGCFMPTECTRGYARMMRSVFESYGIPMALYSDKDSVFRSVKNGAPSQFGNMMMNLGIKMIYANSSQAKGRVERYNGTAQLRLPNDIIRFNVPHDYDILTEWFNTTYRKYLNLKFSFPVYDPYDAFTQVPDNFDYSSAFRCIYTRQMKDDMFSMEMNLYSAVNENGEIVHFNQKQPVTIYRDVFTNEIYIERYGKHYTCVKVGERKRDEIYKISTQKELQGVLNEIRDKTK